MKAITVLRMQRGAWVLLAMVFALAALGAACAGGNDEADEDHELAHEADEVGDVDRTITVVAGEFTFGLEQIHVRLGETVRLVFQNAGAILHDITAPDFAGDVDKAGGAHAHETTMEGMADMDFHAAAEAGEISELVFTATQAGRYDLLCTVPGHAQLGMTAVLVVQA